MTSRLSLSIPKTVLALRSADLATTFASSPPSPAELPISRTLRHTNDCFLTFVAIDENSRPAPVPPLELTTEEERRRFEEGELRREHREALDLELRS